MTLWKLRFLHLFKSPQLLLHSILFSNEIQYSEYFVGNKKNNLLKQNTKQRNTQMNQNPLPTNFLNSRNCLQVNQLRRKELKSQSVELLSVPHSSQEFQRIQVIK